MANNKYNNFLRPEGRRGLSGGLPRPRGPLCRDLPSEGRCCTGDYRDRVLPLHIHNIRQTYSMPSQPHRQETVWPYLSPFVFKLSRPWDESQGPAIDQFESRSALDFAGSKYSLDTRRLSSRINVCKSGWKKHLGVFGDLLKPSLSHYSCRGRRQW